MLDLVVNATVSDTSGTYPGVSATGSGITAPADGDWTIADDQAVTGNKLRTDILTKQTAEEGFTLTHWEIAIEDSGGSTRTERLLFGPNADKERLVTTTTANNWQRCRIRNVQKRLMMFEIDDNNTGYVPSIGDTITHTATGSTATVKRIEDDRWLILENISAGTFEGSYALFNSTPVGNSALVADDGTTTYNITQASFIQESIYSADDSEISKSEWSNPVERLPSTGSARVTISANKTTCLQGEAVLLQVAPAGFNVNLETQELHYEWSVSKAGEQGSFTALTGSKWESAFGSGQNNRCQGFSRVWCFAPKTTSATGAVEVDITVRDRSGNVATDTLTLTVEDPLSAFSASDIYVVTDGARAVPNDPGIPSGNKYTDIDTLVADLPSDGEALILLDTNGNHGATANSLVDFNGKVATRIALMPYDNTGVGPASARTSINYGLRANSATSLFHGINATGPYDSTDPYSVSSRAVDGLNLGGGTFCSFVSCKSAGWNYAINQPSASPYTMYDVEYTDYMDWGTGPGDHFAHAFAGVAGYHNPAMWIILGKSESSAPFSTDHTNYRNSRPDGDRGFSKVLFMAIGGHSAPSQPSSRWFGGAQHPPFVLHVEEIYAEQRGGFGFGTTSAAADNYDGPQDIRLSKAFIICADTSTNLFNISCGPALISNMHAIYADRDGPFKNGASICAVDKGGAAAPKGRDDILNQPFIFENCTGINLLDPTGKTVHSATRFLDSAVLRGLFTDLTARNILFYSEHIALTAGEVAVAEATGTFDTTTRFTPMIEDYRLWDDTAGGQYTEGDDTFADEKLTWNLNNSIDTTRRTDATQTASYEPQSGSSAYQSASGSVPYDDILSRVRPSGTSHQGAFDSAGT